MNSSALKLGPVIAFNRYIGARKGRGQHLKSSLAKCSIYKIFHIFLVALALIVS